MTHKIDGGLPPSRPADLATTGPAQRAGEDRTKPVTAPTAADNMKLTGEAAGLQALQRELGSAPAGLDVARVNEIRAAIADGNYRVDPQQIATRMLDLENALTQ
ncbi:MAG: flagellar biosynthesis anti-sigma factor FlgM [Lysobacterales bacterium RIFOXYD1_FULL_69_11]|nr:MAG: flagellar biosynthesis anti-sigma factor FlgM [Xanthomonadales bacterium RIFOXYA1_FULL_69_10]OHE87274.1 MAG: flagellar biosynthesis anti-sigma factor FlgM [Xanthomonadales bacterium RIFOXYD1_FULL_69_11]